jgi:hypothetical protein
MKDENNWEESRKRAYFSFHRNASKELHELSTCPALKDMKTST